MAHRLPLVVILLVALTGLVPLAHASPTDPTWVPGVYDEGDHDDVVLAVVSAVGLPHVAVMTVDSLPVVVAVVGSAAPIGPTALQFSPAPARAPPIS